MAGNLRTTSKNITELSLIYLALSPTCIEFSPLNPDWFIVGTYKLVENAAQQPSEPEDASPYPAPTIQRRTGSLLLFQLRNNKPEPVQGISFPTYAVYDLHFHPTKPKFFAASMTTGCISFYKLDDSLNTCTFEHLSTHQIFQEEIMITSFAWHPNPRSHQVLACTLSNGMVYVVVFDNDIEQATNATHGPEWVALMSNIHESGYGTVPAWFCAWQGTDTVYSGGDDSKLRSARGFDIPLRSTTHSQEEWNVHEYRGHETGVTAITLLQIGAGLELLLTGSYDEYVRLYTLPDRYSDKENEWPFPLYKAGEVSDCPEPVAKLDLRGGIYRLKQCNLHIDGYVNIQEEDRVNRYPLKITMRVVASCMQKGTRLLEITMKATDSNEDERFRYEYKMKEVGWVVGPPGSELCYASAMQTPQQGLWPKRRFVTSSFADQSLRVCIFDPAIKPQVNGNA